MSIADTVRTSPAVRARGRSTKERSERRAAFWFIAPDALGLTVFLAVPMLLTFVLGFFRVSGFGEYDFIGLANFRRMFADPQFLGSLGRTAIYIGVLVPLLFVVSLALALLVKQRIPFVGVFRSAFFMPYVISLVVGQDGRRGPVGDVPFRHLAAAPADQLLRVADLDHRRAHRRVRPHLLYGEFGYAAAMSSFLVLLMLALSLVVFRFTGGGRFNYAD